MFRFVVFALLMIAIPPPVRAQTAAQDAERETLLRRIRLLEAELKENAALKDPGRPVAQPKKKKAKLNPTPAQSVREMMRLLEQPVETKALREVVKLKQALEYLNDQAKGKLPIFVDREAFIAELGAEAEDRHEVEVSLLPVPARIPLAHALRQIVAQVAPDATYIVYGDYIKITTLPRSAPEHLLRAHTVLTTFDNQPLREVLNAFASEGGFDIHLDPQVETKAHLPISARFRNVTMENALVVVLEMSGLKYVVLERTLFVTTPQRAEALQREEKERSGQRKDVPRAPRFAPKRVEPASE